MKYKKKPVVVEAVQWTGENIMEIHSFMEPVRPQPIKGFSNSDDLIGIETLEGLMIARKNDWIIRGVKGEYYPCKPGIFAATYESADSEIQADARAEYGELLEQIAAIAHFGGLADMTALDAIYAVRRLTLEWFDPKATPEKQVELIKEILIKLDATKKGGG